MKHPLSAKVMNLDIGNEKVALKVLTLAASVMVFSMLLGMLMPKAQASDQSGPSADICKTKEEIKRPFELKSQKLGL